MLSRVRTWWLEGHIILPDAWVRRDDYSLNWLGNAVNAYHHHTRWVRWSWWSYLLGRPAWVSPVSPRCRSYLTVVLCRARNHPAGEVYYNAGGMEPDHSCRNCGEEIG